MASPLTPEVVDIFLSSLHGDLEYTSGFRDQLLRISQEVSATLQTKAKTVDEIKTYLNQVPTIRENLVFLILPGMDLERSILETLGFVGSLIFTVSSTIVKSCNRKTITEDEMSLAITMIPEVGMMLKALGTTELQVKDTHNVKTMFPDFKVEASTVYLLKHWFTAYETQGWDVSKLKLQIIQDVYRLHSDKKDSKVVNILDDQGLVLAMTSGDSYSTFKDFLPPRHMTLPYNFPDQLVDPPTENQLRDEVASLGHEIDTAAVRTLWIIVRHINFLFQKSLGPLIEDLDTKTAVTALSRKIIRAITWFLFPSTSHGFVTYQGLVKAVIDNPYYDFSCLARTTI